MLLGASGAARAVAVELALAGVAHIDIVNRGPERGHELAALIREKTAAQARYLPWAPSFVLPEGRNILVNATSIGLAPDVTAQLDLDWRSLRPGMVVVDAIPDPPHTHLFRQAEARGGEMLDGLGMLVNQAAIAIELWSGVAADRLVMRQALEPIFVA